MTTYANPDLNRRGSARRVLLSCVAHQLRHVSARTLDDAAYLRTAVDECLQDWKGTIFDRYEFDFVRFVQDVRRTLKEERP